MKPKQLSFNIDLNNPEFIDCWNLLQYTRQSVFLTGKAGTGKSTFLKYITANTRKKYVVLAPTGIAAVNVGGQTMHSFFRLPFRPFVSDDVEFQPKRLRERMKYSGDFIKLLKHIELIIIDEISMVRADIIDFIDRILRAFRGQTVAAGRRYIPARTCGDRRCQGCVGTRVSHTVFLLGQSIPRG